MWVNRIEDVASRFGMDIKTQFFTAATFEISV